MRRATRSSNWRCLEHCAELLTEALALLSTKLSAADRAAGWTVPKQRQLRRLVEGWKAEVLGAGTVWDLRAKVMGRWFLYNDVEYGEISELLARADNAITDFQDARREERSKPVPELLVLPTGAPRHESPFFHPSRW